VVGMLIMTQVIELEQAAKTVGRGFLLILAALISLCILKGLFTTALVAVLWLLKRLLAWITVIVLVIAAVMFLARILISRFEKRSPAQGDHDNRGEL